MIPQVQYGTRLLPNLTLNPPGLPHGLAPRRSADEADVDTVGSHPSRYMVVLLSKLV